MWQMSFLGKSVDLKNTKGFHDILKLLLNPEKEFHCMELMGAMPSKNLGTPTLDQKAKIEYKMQIRKLSIKIEDAKELNDVDLLSKLQEEYDDLMKHLSQSLGLAGKPRKIGSEVEKARSAVTWRIRSSIKKINKVHPALGKHLSKSISTGTFCAYKPEFEIHWIT
jgi:hypothetical protein